MSINLASRLSAITTDFTGVNHIVWVEGNAIWHAQFDAIAGRWVNAQAVVTNITENVTSLNLIANGKLIGGDAPGLAVIWQQGDEQKNSSNFQYSAAQYDSKGQLQWDATPTQFTVNETTGGQPFTNLAPRAIADNKGTITVVGQQVNITNANDQSQREDTDLYSTVLNINTVTPGTTQTPNAFYDPPVIVDGVNRVPVSPVPATDSSANSSANFAVAATQSFSTLANESPPPDFLSVATNSAAATNSTGQWSGLQANGSLSFSTGLIQALGLKQYLQGIPEATLKLFLDKYVLNGSLSVSAGLNTETTFTPGETSPLVNSIKLGSQGKVTTKSQTKKTQKLAGERGLVSLVRTFEELETNISFQYQSVSSFQPQSPYYLTNILDILGITLNVTVGPKSEFFQAQLTGSAGIGVVLELKSIPASSSETLLDAGLTTLALDAGSAAFLALFFNNPLQEYRSGFSGDRVLSAIVADTVFLPIENILLGNLTDSSNWDVTQFLVGPTLGVTGNFRLGPGFVNVNGSLGITVTFDTEKGVLVIPIDGGVRVGPLNFSLSDKFTYVWDSNPPLPSSSTSTASAALMSNAVATNIFESFALATTATSPTATVMGSLLTLNFDQPLDTTSIPPASEFSLLTQSLDQQAPSTPTTQIYNVTVSNDPTTGNGVVVLQLTEPLAYSPQFSGTDPQPAGQMTISLTYSGTGLQFSDDTAVSDFSNLSVTNNSPQSLAATFNPTKGTGNDYSTTNQTAFLSNLEADYAQDSPPALALVSSTNFTSGNVLGVWSREVQPLTPIASFVNGDEVYLNFGQSVNTSQSLSPIGGLVAGDSLYLNFGQSLNTSSTPSKNQFTVSVNGDQSRVAVVSVVSITNGTIVFDISDGFGGVAEGDTVTIFYQPSSSSQTDNLYLTNSVESQLRVPIFSQPLTNITGQSASAAPQLLSGSVIVENGANYLITLVFNAPLDADNTPESSTFTIVNNGQNYGGEISNITVSDNIVTFETAVSANASPIGPGDMVTVTYTPSSTTSENLTGLNGVAVGTGSTQLTTLAETSAPSNSQFTVSVNGEANSATVTDVAIANGTVKLTLSDAVTENDTVTLAYQPSASNQTDNLYLTDAVESQLWIPEFSETLTNTTGQSTSAVPQLLGGSVILENGANNLITLIFNAPLDASNTPTSSSFAVINNGQNYSGGISNVTVSDNIVTFELVATDSTPLISSGDMTTVTYTPGSTADQNLTGANGVAIGTVSTQLTTLPETPTTALMAGLYTPGKTSGLTGLQSIPGTDGFNLDPAVASDTNGNALAVWVYTDTSDIDNLSTPGEFYTDDQTQVIIDNLKQSDIYFAYWNGGQWSLAAPLVTNQPGTDNNVTLAYDTTNNQYIAAWLNTQEDTTTGDDDVTIYWASYDPSSSTWSSINQVLSEATPDPLTDLVISSVNGQPALFWTETQTIAYAQLTEDNNPFLYLRLGELSGTTANNSGIWGAGAQGTYNGTYTLNETGALFNSATSAGDPNPAALFSNGGSVTLGSALNVGGSAFSIEFWFKTPSVPSSSTNLVSLDGVFSTALGQDSNGDTILTFDLANSTSATISTSASSNPIAADTWYYVVGTYSDQTQELSLYLNGQPVQTLDSVSATFPTSATFTIAGGTDAVYLDEVALYGTALSYSDTPTSVEDMTGLDLIESLMGTNVVGEKYEAQYADPLPPGPQLQFSLLSSENTWSQQSQINPLSLLEPTALNDANAPVWDVVSATTPNSTGNINPNGQQDTIFRTSFIDDGFQGKTIDSMTLTLSNGITYSVGGSNNDHQLGVVIGNNLINNSAPNTNFSYTILGSTLDLDLLVDTGSAPSNDITVDSFIVNFTDGTIGAYNPPPPSEYVPIASPQFVPPNSVPVSLNNVTVSGKATVTETDDSSLTLIDSGFIINTDNPFVGYSIVSADFNKDGKSDVAVGNRGYTDTSGTSANPGSIQILMGGQPLLLDSATGNLSTPTTSDTASTDSGNSGGFSIVNISDTGQANGQFPLSMATGDVENKGYIDLVIGSPNNNTVYVIYGYYLASASPGTVIDVNSLTSDQGFTINAPFDIASGDNFGFAVAVGNFDGTGGDDIAIGAPSANSGDGAVYIAYNPATESTPTSTPLYSGQSGEQAGYALATSAYQGGGVSTFSGSTTTDDLIVGAPSHTIAVNNNWSGLSGLPTNNPNPFADSSSVEVGAVYVFTSSSSGLETSPSYTYLGTDASTPSANGAAQPLLAGSALASGNWNGDKQLDLAIAAPGADQNDGTVFVLSGGTASANNNPQYLNSQDTNGNFTGASNLIINGGLPLSQTGAVVTSAGDVNSDTYEDLLITAPQGANGTGQSYVVFGKSELLGGTGTIYDLNVTASDNKATFLLNGSEPYQLAGQAAAAIGDINDDGVDDLMISAPNANQLYAVYGHPWLADDGSIKLSNISGDNGFVIDGDLYSGEEVETQIYSLPNQSADTAPALISNNETLYMAYKGDGNDTYIYFTTSTNGGLTWESATQLSKDFNADSSPALAFYNDVLYLAYLGESNNELNFVYSSDNGQSWSGPVTLSSQTSGAGISLVEYQGNLMAIFVASDSSNDILYVYSDNPSDSSSWSTAYKVTNPVEGAAPNQTASNTVSATVLNGSLYLAYRGGTVGSGNNYYVTSTSGNSLSSLSWSSATEVSNATNPNTAPGLTNDGNNLYLTYGDSTTSNALYYLTSSNGTDWSSLEEVTAQTSAYEPAATILDGRLYLGYTGGNQDIYVTALGGTPTLSGSGNNVVMLGDVNGDGFADVLAGGSFNGAVITFGASTQDLLDAATGTDELVITVSNNGQIQEVLSLGDFNGDGLQDFGVIDTNNTFYLVLGSNSLGTQGTLAVDSSYSTVSSIRQANSVGDINGDGYDDLILIEISNTTLFLGNAQGNFANSQILADSQENSFSVGDLNGDGYNDFVQTQNTSATSTNIGNTNSSAFNELEIVWGGNNVNNLTPESYLSATNQPFNGTLNGQMAGGNGDFNGDGQADFFVSAAQPVALMVVETSNSDISYAYFDPFGINWDTDTQVLLNLQTTTHTYSTSDETMGVASYQGNWYFAHSEDYVYWLSGSAINQNSENQFGSKDDYAKPQLITAGDNLYMVVAGGSSNNPYISLYDSSNETPWGPPDTSNEEDSWTNAVTDTNGQDVVTAAVGNLIYFAWTHNSNLYYGYWDTTNSTFTSLGNPTLSSLGVSGDKDPLSMTAINGVLYLALYDSNGDAWLTTYNTTASSPSWQSATEILYTQGNTQVKAEENSITLLGINGQLYVSWYDTAQITSQSQTDNTQYVYLTTTTNPTSATPTWSNSLLLFNTQAGAGLDITGNGDFPGLTPFAWTGMTSILTNNAQGNGTDSLLTLEGASLPLPSTTDNPTLSNYGSLGNQVRFIGDINGDGYDDVLINSPSTALSNQGTPDGALFVIFGNDKGTNSFNLQNLTGNTQEITLVFSPNLDANYVPPASAFSVTTESSHAPTVTDVEISGNQLILTLNNVINTNNSFSVIYGVPTSGYPLVYANGKAVGKFTASLDSKEASLDAPKILSNSYQHQGFMITGLPGSQAGISIDGGGDVNGDGFDDFIIGAPGDGDSLTYVIFGSDFNNTVNQTGTIGDDVMLGSPTGESFVAGQGDDFIETKGGADVVYAGPGNDYVTVSDTYFRRLDGGAGEDVLFFEGYNGQDWDLTTLSPGMRLRNFEVLVTEDFGANTLTLNSLTVTELSSTNTVTVYLDEEDQLVLSSDFDYAGTVYQDNQQFSKYTSNQSAATVLSNRVQALPPVFSYSAPGFLSEMLVVTSAGEVSYYDGTYWEMLEEKTTSPVIAVDMGAVVEVVPGTDPEIIPVIVVGLANGEIQYYDDNNWVSLTETTSPITVIAGNWEGTNQVPEVVVGLSGGEVYYYDGDTSSKLIPLGEINDKNPQTTITTIAGNWEETNQAPEVVVGLANGEVQYYDGNKWTTLPSIDLNSPTSITAMAANWEGTGNPEVVVGLANGEVQYYDGNIWVPLNSPYVNDTITAIAANWEGTGNPEVVVGVGGESETATLSYYEDGEWYTLYTSTTSEQINSIAVDFSVQVPAGGLTKSGYEPASAIGGAIPTVGLSESAGLSLIPYYYNSGAGYFSFDASVVNISALFAGFTGSVSASKANINLINQTPYLTLTEAGGLILSSATGDILWWTTDSYGNPILGATQALMQDDGNFVVSDGTDTLWESKTSGNNGAYLQLDTDGGLYILSASGSVLSTLYSVSESAGSSDSVFQLTAGNQILSGQNVGFWGSQPQEGVWASLTNSPQPIFPNNDSAATTVATSPDFITSSDFSTTASLTTPLAALENTIPSLPTQIYVSNPTVTERTGRAEFTLTRTGDLDKYVWVDYLTQDGDGKAGDRYTPVAGQAVFAPGETTKTVIVPIPNNGQYVGSREFSLAVTLEGESKDPTNVPDAWEAAIATPNEQIRRWNRVPGENGDSVVFDITSTNSPDRIVTFDVDLDGMVMPLIWNPATENYENIPFSTVNGITQFQDIDGDSLNDLYRMHFQDGGLFDGDGLVNGLVALDFQLAQLKLVDVPSSGGRIEGTEGNDYISAQNSTGTNRLQGLDGMDILIGSPQRDVLIGGDGNDQLFGGGGVDQLFGGAGEDLLDGGPGLDFLYGGVDADNFVLRAGDGGDRIMDFNGTEGDRLLLDGLSFGALSFDGNKISLGAELLATVIDSTGTPVTDFANNPQWFVSS